MVTTTLLIIIYLSFISLGLPDSLLGSAWPTMVNDLSAPLWGAGLISMTVSLCTIISSVNSARLIRRFGTGKLTALSGLLTATALMGMSFAPHYVFLLLLAIPLGLGAGAVDAAINNYVALHCEARHMNWLHCFWGVGTVISPYVMSAALSHGMKWTAGYRGVSAMQFALAVVLLMTLNLWGGEKAKEEERSAKVLSVRQVLALPGAKQGLFGFTCYCAVESTFMLWSATYLVMTRGMDAAAAASMGGLFFVGMTVGRGVSGFIAMKLRPKQMVRLGQVMMVLGALLLFVPGQNIAVFGLLFMGLGCAPVYPNIVQDTPRNYGAENSQAVIGVQMAFAYVGSLTMPTVFGWIAEAVGYGALPVFSLALSVVMVLLFNSQQRIVDRRNAN
ncbi:MAG: MFS transporter [Clostridiales bacterium]|nr:MFS transporter [Clostridiales bacterium]